MADGMRTEGGGRRLRNQEERRTEYIRMNAKGERGVTTQHRACTYTRVRVKRASYSKEEGGRERERERERCGTTGRVSEGVRSTNQYAMLNPACVPAVHDARNVSPTDPNSMDDIAAAHATPAYVACA